MNCSVIIGRFEFLPIQFEIGRWSRLREWICKICNSGQVEDELHFLVSCTKYLQACTSFNNSMTLLNPNFATMSHSEKLIFVMRKYSILLFSRYLDVIYAQRKLTLYNPWYYYSRYWIEHNLLKLLMF